ETEIGGSQASQRARRGSRAKGDGCEDGGSQATGTQTFDRRKSAGNRFIRGLEGRADRRLPADRLGQLVREPLFGDEVDPAVPACWLPASDRSRVRPLSLSA